MTQPLILMSGAIVLASLLGGWLPLRTVLTHTRLQLYLSFASGVMLGAAFFHMLPEAVEQGGTVVLRWAAFGLVALFLVERFFSSHHHEPPDVERADPHLHHDTDSHDHAHHHHAAHEHARPEPQGSSLHWKAAAFGMAVHTLSGGLALASTAAAEFAQRGSIGPATWGVFLATLMHKPADAMTITSLMLRDEADRRSAQWMNLGFALMLPLGILLFLGGVRVLDPGSASLVTAATLGFSAGTFLNIALSDLLPELHFHNHDRVKLSLALLAGFGLMAATVTFEPGHLGHGHEAGGHEPPVPSKARP